MRTRTNSISILFNLIALSSSREDKQIVDCIPTLCSLLACENVEIVSKTINALTMLHSKINFDNESYGMILAGNLIDLFLSENLNISASSRRIFSFFIGGQNEKVLIELTNNIKF